MANLPLAFGELLVGGILITASITNNKLGNVIKGIAAPAGGTSTNTASVTPAGSSSNLVGSVTSSDLSTVGAKYGWTGSQLSDWMQVISMESGGNPNATNPTSGAYGIGQMLGSGGHATDVQKYQQYGGNAASVIGQLEGMAGYIDQRYGNPANALNHENTDHWY